MNFVEELKVDDKFLLRLIKNKYSRLKINSIEEFENYLKDNNLNIKKIKEKFTIELIWNDLIFQKFIFVAEALDSWRLIPRAFLGVYMYLLYYTTFWFMDLSDPTFEQSGLISIVVGAGAAWFGLYAGTSKK